MHNLPEKQHADKEAHDQAGVQQVPFVRECTWFGSTYA